MGPAALDFFTNHIASNAETWKVQQFLAKMSSIIAHWNSRLILETRAAYPGNDWRPNEAGVRVEDADL